MAQKLVRAARLRASPPMLGHMLEAQKRERDLLVREFAQVRGLMPLLMRHRNGGHWTREERLALREQLTALVHLSPYLVVLALPGSFMILPVLAWWLDRRRIQRAGPRLGAPG
ncbi:MAG: hypothetical protein Q8O25_04065 [Sulfurisoma sp.]|nr:hypothetical protein [Sulfurisoma sp.]